MGNKIPKGTIHGLQRWDGIAMNAPSIWKKCTRPGFLYYRALHEGIQIDMRIGLNKEQVCLLVNPCLYDEGMIEKGDYIISTIDDRFVEIVKDVETFVEKYGDTPALLKTRHYRKVEAK